jgi:hypothetical protein
MINNTCFVTSLTPLLEPQFSFKAFIILATTFCWVMATFACKM